eukprot:m51a1_g13694 putative hect domain and rcc1 family domain containing protein (1787) ;mRNA; r:16347-29979
MMAWEDITGKYVVRGKDWKWSNQDGGAGNVGHVESCKDGRARVKWANGYCSLYRYGAEGAFDLLITTAAPVKQTLEDITGKYVVRGKDWKWADQDGGAGNVGHVESCKDGRARVKWANGYCSLYRYGAEGAFDLQIAAAPEKPKIEDITGKSVVRGRDWKWSDQDGGAGHVGRVESCKDGRARVRWPNGYCSMYRYGAEGAFDLGVVDDAPTTQATSAVAEDITGKSVVRGKDWKWSNQDGGAGCVGRVESCKDGRARVKWANGYCSLYRYGAEGAFDLQITAAPEEQKLEDITGKCVVRGKDWKWSDQDGGAGCVGRVESCKDGRARVKWANGYSSMYRYGAEGAFDLQITQEALRGREAEVEDITGKNVVRGRDWKWSDQDGGAGNVGHVESCKDGRARVKWASGYSSMYRYGAEGAFDLQIATAAPERHTLEDITGKYVVRGKDWKWADQDGGAGNVGHVESCKDGRARVKWPNGYCSLYRYGAEGAMDLELTTAPAVAVHPPPAAAAPSSVVAPSKAASPCTPAEKAPRAPVDGAVSCSCKTCGSAMEAFATYKDWGTRGSWYCASCRSGSAYPVYTCDSCKYRLCCKCAALKAEFEAVGELECRGGHQMQGFLASNDKGAMSSYSCDGCAQRSKFPMFSCRECSFDLCLDCAKAGVASQGAPYAPPAEHCPDGESVLFPHVRVENAPDPKPLDMATLEALLPPPEPRRTGAPLCPLKHELTLFNETFDQGFPNNYHCSACESRTAVPAWVCARCEWAKCAACIEKGEQKKEGGRRCSGLTCPEGHPLVAAKHAIWQCRCCQRDYGTHVCSACAYGLCSSCCEARLQVIAAPGDLPRSPVACPNGHAMRVFDQRHPAAPHCGCYECGSERSSMHGCALCGYLLCSDCVERAAEVFAAKPSDVPRSEVPCMKGHQMVVFATAGMKGGPSGRIACSECRQTESYPAHLCSDCGFILCQACADKRLRAKELAGQLSICPVPCARGHTMRWYEDRSVTGAPWPNPRCLRCHQVGNYPQFGCWQCGTVFCGCCWEEVFTAAARPTAYGEQHPALGPQYCKSGLHVMSEVTCDGPTRRFVCSECKGAAKFAVQLCQKCCYAACGSCLRQRLALDEGRPRAPPEPSVMFEQKIDCGHCKGLVTVVRHPRAPGSSPSDRDQCCECGMAGRWPMSRCHDCGRVRCCHCTEALARAVRQHNQKEDAAYAQRVQKAECEFAADPLAKTVRHCRKEHLLHRVPMSEVSKDGVDWTCSRCEVRYRMGDGFRCPCKDSANLCLVCVVELSARTREANAKAVRQVPREEAIGCVGALAAWGNKETLGVGFEGTRCAPHPLRVPGFPAAGRSVVRLYARAEYTAALLDDGSVWTWGSDNWCCQLGNGGQGFATRPGRVQLPAKATAIAAGGDFMLAVLEGGELWGWGSNELHQLAEPHPPAPPPRRTRVLLPNGKVVTALQQEPPRPDYHPSPARIAFFRELPVRFARVFAGRSFAVAETTTGELYSWGANGEGQLGQSSSASSSASPDKIIPVWGSSARVADVQCGDEHALLLTDSGDVFGWGCNDEGQLAYAVPAIMQTCDVNGDSLNDIHTGVTRQSVVFGRCAWAGFDLAWVLSLSERVVDKAEFDRIVEHNIHGMGQEDCEQAVQDELLPVFRSKLSDCTMDWVEARRVLEVHVCEGFCIESISRTESGSVKVARHMPRTLGRILEFTYTLVTVEPPMFPSASNAGVSEKCSIPGDPLRTSQDLCVFAKAVISADKMLHYCMRTEKLCVMSRCDATQLMLTWSAGSSSYFVHE